MKRFHLVYKTTNIVNGKFYIGKHSTDVIEDGYLGSGVLLTKAVKKYGAKNFVREVLFVFDNAYDMEAKEKEMVTEDLVLDEQSYNVALGGQGGNLGSQVNAVIGVKASLALKGKPKSEAHKQALRQTYYAKTYRPSEETKKKIGDKVRQTWQEMCPDQRKEKCGHPGSSNPFYGKAHTQATINKIKSTIGDSRKGHLNPRAKPVTINGTTYRTRKECMEVLGLTKGQFYKLLGETKWLH